MAKPALKFVASDLDTAIAEKLAATGKLTPEVADRAKRIAAEQGESFGATVVKLGLVSERELATIYAETLKLPMVLPEDYPAQAVLPAKLSARFLRQARLLPIQEAPTHIVMAVADPTDRSAIGAVEIALARPVKLRVAVPAELEAAMDRLYGGEAHGVADIVSEAGATVAGGDDADIDRLRDLASEAPVVRLVSKIITDAVEKHASDIHIEPFEHSHRVRYRINGSLVEVEAPPKAFHAAIVSRIKILSHLDIAERRRPQDGRINISARGKPVDIRVSIVPTLHGESVVMRLLNRDAAAMNLDDIEFSASTMRTIKQLIEEPNGVLLVTGPTGSGKTTTLYGILGALNKPDTKIITVEDPVEYQIDGINQIPVQDAIGVSFAAILRSVLRQNPNIIMIGEMRDTETAEIGVQAALTGHLVLTTLHTNDAASSVMRLIDMGVPDYLVAHTVIGVVAQRLVKRMCQNCREPEPVSPELAERLQLSRYALKGPPVFYRAKGCKTCNGTGAIGRVPIAEAMAISPAIRRQVLAKASTKEIENTAMKDGMERMVDDGIRKALNGIVTLQEVLRVARI